MSRTLQVKTAAQALVLLVSNSEPEASEDYFNSAPPLFGSLVQALNSDVLF